jgi:hypothetical protein
MAMTLAVAAAGSVSTASAEQSNWRDALIINALGGIVRAQAGNPLLRM